MKKSLMVILIGMGFININGQTFNWAKREGLWAYDYGKGIANDASGNVYVAGKYEMNAIFSGVTLPCQGNHDIYLAKYNSAGALTWIRTAGGYSGDYAHCLAVDNSYVYVAGEIEGSGNIVRFIGSSITLTPKGSNDAFVAKYDLNGSLLWAKRGGDVYDDKPQGIAYDKSGNIYICGYFRTKTVFGNTVLYGSGGNDIFIAKLDPNGNYLWAKKAGSAGRDEATSIVCDAAGNVYICGMHGNGCSFGSQTVNTPDGYSNSYVAKYSTSGALLWVKSAGGVYDDVAWSLTTDKFGKIIVTGQFNSSMNFGSTNLYTSGNADVFIGAYDGAGNAVWANKAGGNQVDLARGIGTDGSNIFITGQFGGTANFGATTKTAADNADVFISCLNNNGQFLWTSTAGGSPDAAETLGFESGIAVCAEPSGNVYATGAILNGGVFGNTPLYGYARTDVFITKLKNNFGSPSAREMPESVALNAQTKGKKVILTWPVSNITDSISYTVEKSKDSTNFDAIGKATMNSNGEYSFIDSLNNDDQTSVYYRVLQTYGSDKMLYSNITAINIDEDSYLQCLVFPNPTKNSLNVSIKSLGEKQQDNLITTFIYDYTGNEKIRSEINFGESVIDVTSLTSGIYLVVIRNGDKVIFEERVVIQ
jgi:hypothetical protein